MTILWYIRYAQLTDGFKAGVLWLGRIQIGGHGATHAWFLSQTNTHAVPLQNVLHRIAIRYICWRGLFSVAA
jgi:hypothetical protein